MSDRIEEWRLFAAVASLGSFSRAADAQRCSPQAVTRAVAAIEGRIGARLLHRTTRSVSLTAEGERYLAKARAVVAEVDALEAPSDVDAALRGVLVVTAPVLFGQLHVAPALDAFLRAHPAVDARLSLLDRVVSLAEERVDVAVRIGALPDSSLVARALGEVRSVVCASPAYLKKRGTPKAPADLAAHDCVVFSGMVPIPGRWSFPGAGARAGGGSSVRATTVTVRPRLVTDDGRAAIQAALDGLGLVRALSYQVAEHVRKKRLVVVLARFESRALPVQLVRSAGPASRLVGAFVEHAAATILRTKKA